MCQKLNPMKTLIEQQTQHLTEQREINKSLVHTEEAQSRVIDGLKQQIALLTNKVFDLNKLLREKENKLEEIRYGVTKRHARLIISSPSYVEYVPSSE